jgi:hypothetical protein
MNSRMTSPAVLLLMALALLGGCAAPNRQIYYGTWTNEDGYFKKTVRTPDGLVQNYYSINDTTPAEIAKVEIVKCWLDSNGNVWFKTEGTVAEGPNKNNAPKIQTLEKINKSGTFLEVMVSGVVEFRPQSFPTKIDPSPQKKREHLYRAFNKAEEQTP